MTLDLKTGPTNMILRTIACLFQKANAAWAKGKCNSFFSCKEYLEYCLQEIRRICAELKIELNEKKTRIVKLSHGFTFLKTQIYLTDTGKILRKPCRKAVVRCLFASQAEIRDLDSAI